MAWDWNCVMYDWRLVCLTLLITTLRPSVSELTLRCQKMQCCLITTHLWFVTCQNQICLHPFQCTEKVGGWSRCRCYRCNRETWLLSCSCIVQALHPFTFLVTFNPTIKVTQNLPPLEISPKKFICIGWLWKPECRNRIMKVRFSVRGYAEHHDS